MKYKLKSSRYNFFQVLYLLSALGLFLIIQFVFKIDLMKRGSLEKIITIGVILIGKFLAYKLHLNKFVESIDIQKDFIQVFSFPTLFFFSKDQKSNTVPINEVAVESNQIKLSKYFTIKKEYLQHPQEWGELINTINKNQQNDEFRNQP